VPNLPALLAKIPDEFKPIAALGIGTFVLVSLSLFHGMCLHRILLQNKRGERHMRSERPHLLEASFRFGWTVFLMLDLHIVEILIWTLALTLTGLIVHAYDAIYFCANSYTTLGQGKVDVGEHWRILSPIIGISGLFTFAWTTSALVDVVASYGRLLETLEDERDREMKMRSALRKEEWEALRRDRDAMQSEREKIRMETAGVSFFQWLRIWKEENGRMRELRSAKATEIEALHHKERLDEEKLVPGIPRDDSGGEE
jgi:hypothetical protein